VVIRNRMYKLFFDWSDIKHQERKDAKPQLGKLLYNQMA